MINDNKITESRTLPHSNDAETMVLGSMMLNEDHALNGLERLDEIDFYNAANRTIFSAMKDLSRNNSNIDIITVGDYLSTKRKEHLAGGKGYLEDLVNKAFIKGDYDSWLNIVEQKSQLRRLIKASQNIMEEAFSSTDASAVLNHAEREIFDISTNKKKLDFEELPKVMVDVMNHFRDNPFVPGQLSGVDTGFYDLNKNLAGFQKTDLIILAARPAMGKTALALNFARNAAIKSKSTVAIFSLEMSKEQLALRMMSMGSRVDARKIKTGDLDTAEFELLGEAIKEYKKTKIFVSECPGATVREIRSQCRKIKIKHGLDLVVIDYLQLMTGDGESHQIMISNISRSLKALAMELGCPVIALSQLSRRPEERKDHRPILSDLRDSGSIEQDADVVMLLFREEYHNMDDPALKGKTNLIIAKHRHGETQNIDLHWKGEYQLFMSVGIDERYPEFS